MGTLEFEVLPIREVTFLADKPHISTRISGINAIGIAPRSLSYLIHCWKLVTLRQIEALVQSFMSKPGSEGRNSRTNRNP